MRRTIPTSHGPKEAADVLIGTEERGVSDYHPSHFEALTNLGIESEVMKWPGCEMD